MGSEGPSRRAAFIGVKEPTGSRAIGDWSFERRAGRYKGRPQIQHRLQSVQLFGVGHRFPDADVLHGAVFAIDAGIESKVPLQRPDGRRERGLRLVQHLPDRLVLAGVEPGERDTDN